MNKIISKQEAILAITILVATVMVSLAFIVFSPTPTDTQEHMTEADYLDEDYLYNDTEPLFAIEEFGELQQKLADAETDEVRRTVLEQAAQYKFGADYTLATKTMQEMSQLIQERQFLRDEYPTLQTDREMQDSLSRQYEIFMLESFNR